MSAKGLYQAVGGFRKRERECCDGTLICKLRGCENPSAGYIAAWNGAQPICEAHIAQAESLGYAVHRPGYDYCAKGGAVCPPHGPCDCRDDAA